MAGGSPACALARGAGSMLRSGMYAYIERGSRRSAEIVVPILASALRPKSVVDFGCGRGAWLKVWAQNGIDDLMGLDGPYVPRESLLIEDTRFREADLTREIDLGRRFDLAVSLEVGEHLPTAAAPVFVRNICRAAPLVAFSAAVPGQGGEHHINEQSYEFWRSLFGANRYRAFDFVRPRVDHAKAVEPWYRYNILLFVEEAAMAGLPDEVSRTRLADDAPVPDVSPLHYRVRKRILKTLPVDQVTRLAVAKHRAIIAGSQLKRAVGLSGRRGPDA
jgi:SAM-dependent methyltransferase